MLPKLWLTLGGTRGIVGEKNLVELLSKKKNNTRSRDADKFKEVYGRSLAMNGQWTYQPNIIRV